MDTSQRSLIVAVCLIFPLTLQMKLALECKTDWSRQMKLTLQMIILCLICLFPTLLEPKKIYLDAVRCDATVRRWHTHTGAAAVMRPRLGVASFYLPACRGLHSTARRLVCPPAGRGTQRGTSYRPSYAYHRPAVAGADRHMQPGTASRLHAPLRSG